MFLCKINQGSTQVKNVQSEQWRYQYICQNIGIHLITRAVFVHKVQI